MVVNAKQLNTTYTFNIENFLYVFNLFIYKQIFNENMQNKAAFPRSI